MDDYKPNSHRVKEESSDIPEKKIEKVISGAAKTKKKGEIRKFADVFISDDISKVKSYVLMDVLVPALKKAVSDIVTNGIDMVLYGETGHTSKGSMASKVSYRNYFDKPTDHRDYGRSMARPGYDYGNVFLESRGEAEEVLSRMDELISSYGVVSVADLYDLCGITGNYTDNKYGWTDICSAQPIRTPDGYMLKLSKALPLN